MGIGRMIRRRSPLLWTIDAVKNIASEQSLTEGIKRTVKEDLCEDNPLTGTLYRMGKYDGKKEGYVEASCEYEQKLLNQADMFLKQTRIFKSEKDAYEQLMNEYEKAIGTLMEKASRTEGENEYLQQLLLKERMLKKIPENF